MSLVIVEKHHGMTFIYSDTKISAVNEKVDNLSSEVSNFGVLKCQFVTEEIVVCFAGVLEFVKQAYAEVYNSPKKLSEVKSILLKYNKKSNDETDFLVCVNENGKLNNYKVSEGRVLKTSNNYIGDHFAFQTYRNEYNDLKKELSSINAYSLNDISIIAFQHVINSQKHEEVGTLLVKMISTPTSFKFHGSSSMVPGIVFKQEVSTEVTPIKFSSAGAGSFTIYMPDSSNNYYAFYVVELGRGVFYDHKDYLLQPILSKKCSYKDYVSFFKSKEEYSDMVFPPFFDIIID